MRNTAPGVTVMSQGGYCNVREEVGYCEAAACNKIYILLTSEATYTQTDIAAAGQASTKTAIANSASGSLVSQTPRNIQVTLTGERRYGLTPLIHISNPQNSIFGFVPSLVFHSAAAAVAPALIGVFHPASEMPAVEGRAQLQRCIGIQ